MRFPVAPMVRAIVGSQHLKEYSDELETAWRAFALRWEEEGALPKDETGVIAIKLLKPAIALGLFYLGGTLISGTAVVALGALGSGTMFAVDFTRELLKARSEVEIQNAECVRSVLSETNTMYEERIRRQNVDFGGAWDKLSPSEQACADAYWDIVLYRYEILQACGLEHEFAHGAIGDYHQDAIDLPALREALKRRVADPEEHFHGRRDRFLVGITEADKARGDFQDWSVN